MIIDKVLGIVDVYKGTVVEGCQCFQMTLQDSEGNLYLTSFACMPNYEKQIVKSFRRMQFIPPPTTESKGATDAGTETDAN